MTANRHRLFGLAVAAAVATMAVGAGVERSEAAPALEPLKVDAPRDYAHPAAGTVHLSVAIAHALEQGAKGDPIFVVEALAESGVEAAPRGLIDSLAALRRTHDLIFVDQRGVTGESALTCPEPSGPAAAAAVGPFDARRLGPCRSAAARRVDLGSLNSATFAADLETVRKAVGAPRIELVGYFYGTRIIEAYLSRWPEHASAAVLVDVSPFDYPTALASRQAVESAVESTLADCASDHACAAAFPRLREEREALRRRLTSSAVEVDVKAQASVGSKVEADGRMLSSWLDEQTLRWREAAYWPAEVHALATGSGSRTLERFVRERQGLFESYPLGERIAVDCAEDMPADREIAAAPEGIRDGPEGLQAEAVACKAWPHRRVSGRRLLAWPTPTLAITGAFDAMAPAEAAKRAMARLPRAQLVVLPNRARAADWDWDACAGPMTTAFLLGPAHGRVDDACRNTLARPPFATPPAS